MASNSKSRASDNVDDRGAGGKILRGRRLTKAVVPYQRPAEDSPKVEEKGWFSSLISGAGRILSSVLPLENESYSSSSASDSELEDNLELDECTSDENVNFMDEFDTEFNPNECQTVVASTSKTKSSIEKLLEQETYTREEYKRLMEIIESRVVGPPISERCKDVLSAEVPDKEIYLHTPRVLGLSSQNYFLGGTPHSSRYLRTFNPSFSDDVGVLTHTSNVVIMEAKKWVEDKRQSSSSKLGPNCTPCTMNTDMLHHDGSNDVGSPVDVAKSYMHALPPWRSQITGSAGFKSTSSMEHKRSHVEADAGDFLRAISTEIESFDTHEKELKLGPSGTSSESDKIVRQVHSKVLDSTTISDATENANGGCSDTHTGNFSVYFRKNTKTSNPFSDFSASVSNIIPTSEEIANVEKENHDDSAVEPLTSETKSRSTSFIKDSEICEILDQKFADDQVIYVEEHSPTEEQVATIAGLEKCNEGSLILDHNEDRPTVEPVTQVSEDTTCLLQRYDGIPPTKGSPSSIRTLEKDTRVHSGNVPMTEVRHHHENHSSTMGASNGALHHQTSSLPRSETHDNSKNPSEQKANCSTSPDDSIKPVHEVSKVVGSVDFGRATDAGVTVKQIFTDPPLTSNLKGGGVRGRARKAVAKRRGRGRTPS